MGQLSAGTSEYEVCFVSLYGMLKRSLELQIVEQSYESLLRGKVGYQHIEVTAGGLMIRELSKSAPLPGKNVQLTIDSELQKLIELI